MAQGETVIASPQGATLQGSSQLTHAGEGPVPALQREDPRLQLNGEFTQVHVLCARCLLWGAGGGEQGSRQGARPAPAQDPRPRPTCSRWATVRMRRLRWLALQWTR